MSTATLSPVPSAATFEKIIRDQLKPDVQKIDHEGFYPEGFLKSYGGAGAFSPVREPGSFYEAINNCALVGETCGSTAFSTPSDGLLDAVRRLS